MPTGMKLDKLKAIREAGPIAELLIPEAELFERYENLYTGAVNDVLREFALLNQALPFDIAPLRDEMKVAGVAFTIRSVKDPTIEGEMDTRAAMLEEITEGSVCVWQSSGDDEAAHWGEVMTKASKSRGCKGAVIAGGIRDTHQVLAQNFPVFHRYRTSNGSLARCKITGYQVVLQIGHVIIRPGDIIFGDIDGVLVVPRDIAVQVLERAEEIKAGEKEIKQWLDEGMTAEEVVKKGGYF